MPVKFGKTTIVKDRQTGKLTTQHEYMKSKSKEELFDYINNGQKPKIKQKCRNELTRRGVKIVYVDRSSEE